MVAMEASLKAGALDACCFHAQQAVEKFLKAYLISRGLPYPFTHNLVKLLRLAAGKDRAFSDFQAGGEELTPYAVELRYDEEFWPSVRAAERACRLAKELAEFVRRLLPQVSDLGHRHDLQ
jgi:HEPN domain-containing protein